jgi:leader peptidase (prepilin peptidase) / N-methyltransferase
MDNDFFYPLKVLLCDRGTPLGVVFFFVWGTFWGSFLNVCIYRIPYGRSIVFPGSSCPQCGEPIAWWQNIPLLGYAFIKGKCSSCFCKISLRYPMIELMTGLACALLFYHYHGLTKEFVYFMIFASFLIIVFFIDLDHWLILDAITFPGIVTGLLGSLILTRAVELMPQLTMLIERFPWRHTLMWHTFFDALTGVVMGYLLFAFISLVGSLLLRQEAMGGGDIKFAALIGAFLGCHDALVAFVVSFFLGFLYAVPLLLVRKRKGRDPVPFGTFMALAAFIVMLWGNAIVRIFYNTILPSCFRVPNL